jgi:hypothetical protein
LVSLASDNHAGLADHFDATHAFGWPIATVTGSIIGFAEDKFQLDTTGFQNSFAGSGSFGIRQYGQSLYVVYQPTAVLTPGPAVTFNLNPEGRTTGVTMTFSNNSGLRYGGVSSTRNVTVTCQPLNEAGAAIGSALVLSTSANTELPPGTVEARLVATKVDINTSGSVNSFVINEDGQLRSTDPVFARLQVNDAGWASLRLSDVPVQERYWSLVNNNPGIEEIEFWVKGVLVLRQSLTPGETALGLLDLALEMGDAYGVEIIARGRPGATGSFVLADFPLTAANLIGAAPTLRIQPTLQGLRISWPDPSDKWRLQQSDSLGQNWGDVPMTAQASVSSKEVVLGASSNAGFFRLRARD